MKGFELTTNGNSATLKVPERIDESCEFPEEVKCDKLIIDFENLSMINSYGVRLWLVWTKEKRGFNSLEIINCRATFLHQSLYIPEIIPSFGRVTSFYVPFFDVDNEESVDVKMEYGKDYDDKSYTLPQPANEAGHALELDVEDRYFDFLKLKK